MATPPELLGKRILCGLLLSLYDEWAKAHDLGNRHVAQRDPELLPGREGVVDELLEEVQQSRR
jgi:hypothetical protein